VGLIQQLEETLLNKLTALFQPVITPLEHLWNILKSFFTAVIQVVPETIALVQLVRSEVFEWKNFRESINFKAGVINVQSVQDRIQQLIDELVAGWHALVHLFTDGFKITVKPLSDAEEAAAELADLFEGLGKFGLKDFLTKIGPKLEKAGGKILEVLAIIQAVAEELLKVVRELHDIVQAVKDVRETFETGEGLFLSQKNRRRLVTLDDGSTMKIRVGNLHT